MADAPLVETASDGPQVQRAQRKVKARANALLGDVRDTLKVPAARRVLRHLIEEFGQSEDKFYEQPGATAFVLGQQSVSRYVRTLLNDAQPDADLDLIREGRAEERRAALEAAAARTRARTSTRTEQ